MGFWMAVLAEAVPSLFNDSLITSWLLGH
jgi:hypothetical protein